MTDEEEAIEWLKRLVKLNKRDNLDNTFAEILLNLIEKNSKEIEELKNGQIDFWISDKEIEERIRNKFVSKDKIKAMLENEIINISGFECVAKEDVQSLLEKE